MKIDGKCQRKSTANSSNKSPQDNHSRRKFLTRVGATGVTGLSVGLAGCSSSGGEANQTDASSTDSSDGATTGGSQGSVTLEFVASPSLVEVEDGFKSVLREVGLSDNIELKLTQKPPYGKAKSRHQQVFTSGQERPDIIQSAYNWVLQWAPRGYLANLEDLLSAEAKNRLENDYFDSVAQVAMSNGGIYSIPAYPDCLMMYYRKDLFEEAGYGSEIKDWATKPPTYERLTNIIADVYSQTDVEYGFATYGSGAQLAQNIWLQAVHAYGGSVFGGKENELTYGSEIVGNRPVTINEEAQITVTKMLKSWMDGDDDRFPKITDNSIMQWGYDSIMEVFQSGDALALQNWPYAIVPLDEEFGDRLGVMPQPVGVSPSEAKYDGFGGPVSSLGGWQIAVNANSPYKKEAAEFLSYLTHPDVTSFIFSEVGWFPPNKKVLQTEAAKEAAPAGGKHLDALQTSNANTVPYPVTPVFPQQVNRIDQEVTAAMKGDKSPEEAMESLQKAFEQIENNYSG